MAHELPPLPYELGALEPHISTETLEYHYAKHHAGYVAKLNDLIPGTEFESATLEETIRTASGGIFNNAAQIWNHTFYWNCMSPDGGGDPPPAVAKALEGSFGSLQEFVRQFGEAAKTHFGSGWAWLVRKPDGSLMVAQTSNAGCPLASGDVPLLTCDVWEHAYYIDYRNARADYVEAFWKVVNWGFLARHLEA